MELTHWKENKEIIGSKQDQPFLPGNELFSQMELYLPFVGANSTLGLTSQPSLPANMILWIVCSSGDQVL